MTRLLAFLKWFWGLGWWAKFGVVVVVGLSVFAGSLVLQANAPTTAAMVNEDQRFPKSNTLVVTDDLVFFAPPGVKNGQESCFYPFSRYVSPFGGADLLMELNPEETKNLFGKGAKLDSVEPITVSNPTPETAWKAVQKHVKGYAKSCNLAYLYSSTEKDKKG